MLLNALHHHFVHCRSIGVLLATARAQEIASRQLFIERRKNEALMHKKDAVIVREQSKVVRMEAKLQAAQSMIRQVMKESSAALRAYEPVCFNSLIAGRLCEVRMGFTKAQYRAAL